MRKTRQKFIALGALAVLAIVCVLFGVGVTAAVVGSGLFVFGMILDERLEFCDATALNTGGAGSYLVGDVIDLKRAAAIIGDVQMYCVIQVDTLPTSGGAATADFQLASDAQAAIATDGSATIHARTGAKAIAALAAGTTFILPLPPAGAVPYERFLGILQTTATAAFTAGKINAFITSDVKQWKATADAL